MSPIEPHRRPLYSAPCACAASSMTTRPCARAISRIGSMSAGWPYRWTGMMALVRGVIAASIWPGSIVKSSGRCRRTPACAPGVDDRRDGRDEGERHRDHFVAGADAGGEQRQVQRARAGVDRDGLRRAAERGEVALERGDLVAEDELRAVEHAQDRRVDLRLDRAGTGLQIDERNHACDRSLELDQRAAVAHRLGGRFEQPHDAQAGFAVGHRRGAPGRCSRRSAPPRPDSASVTSSCGAHMSPVR